MRASYRQEMTALVDRFWEQGARKFGVYYQMDAYGRSGTDGVARGLALHNARIVAAATSRGAKFEEEMRRAVGERRRAGLDVVFCAGACQGCGAFVRSARDLGWTVPISNVSLVGSDAMLGLLVPHGKKAGREYTTGLVNSQVVPSYEDLTLPAVAEYRALVARHKPAVPETLRDRRYVPQNISFIGLEGFVNAKVVVEALRRAGPDPTRAGLREGLEWMRNVDLGIQVCATPCSRAPQVSKRTICPRLHAFGPTTNRWSCLNRAMLTTAGRIIATIILALRWLR